MNTRTAAPVLAAPSQPLHSKLSAPKQRHRPKAVARFLPPPIAAPAGPCLVPAKAGDHLPIHRLLLAAFGGPSSVEFQAQLDEPGYDPADRLVVKLGEQVAAHVRASRRTILLAGVPLAAVQLMDLATAAEHRGQGFASSLVAAAERRAREQGVLLGLTRTRAPDLFARRGWSVCGRHAFSTAGARQILAQLQATSEGLLATAESATACLRPDTRQPIAIRPLRRIELPALMRLYAAELTRRHGSPVRSEEYWEWLLNRGSCDRIYVAAEGPESADLKEQLAAIRGAVFVREGRIVELLLDGGRRDIAEHLLARVCGDASEQDHWHIRFDAPPSDPLHRLLAAAGGQSHQAEEVGCEVFMAKIFHPRRLLALLGDVLCARLLAARLTRPVQLGLEIRAGAQSICQPRAEVARLRLVFTGSHMKLAAGPLRRNYLSLRLRDLTPLVLGHWNADDAAAAGRIEASSKAAATLASLLFPQLPWWRPPLDDLLTS